MSTIKEETEYLHQKHGVLRPEDMVEFARSPNTALHSQFPWDDAEAANICRLDIARRIIRTIVRVLPTQSEPVRVWVSLKNDRIKDGGGYRPLAAVMSNQEMRAQLLAQARREAEAYRARYQQLEELVPVFAAMDQVFSSALAKAN